MSDAVAPQAVLRALEAEEARRRLPELGALLVDAVAGGASVNFLAGFAQPDAEAFWRGQIGAIADRQRRLIVAEEGGRLVGTVVLSFASQPNQPHRADVGKMLVHSDARRRGLGRRLLAAAEDAARIAGRTLLVLDTEEGSGGDLLYRRCGWTPVGTIPGYALTTDGRPAGATVFYKEIAPAPRSARPPASGVTVREATEADLPAILDIYNDAVLNTLAIWNDSIATLENRAAILADRRQRGYPFLVAEKGGDVLGYATFGDFRPYDGFRLTVENSVYVHKDARGMGIANLLMPALIEAGIACGKHVMVAGIEANNAASMRLHRRFGFVETARMPQVGIKFGKWLDLVFMQRVLDEAGG